MGAMGASFARSLLVVALALAGAATADAAEAVINGSFEANGGAGSSVLAGWTLATRAGSGGNFYAQQGTVLPRTPFTVPAPARGTFAAASDQMGPGTSVLYQDIAVPAAGQTVLSMRLFVQNQAEDYVSPASLDYAVFPNQQVRVDIMSPLSAFDALGAGVLANVFATQPGDAQTMAYRTLVQDLTPWAGSTVRVRIAAVDTLQGLNVAVDAVSTQLCDLDIDSDSRLLGTTDALLIVRQLLGLSGAALSNGAVASSGSLAAPARLSSLVAAMRSNGTLDIDGNGVIEAQSDGVLLLRAMLGMSGNAAVAGALGTPPRTRNDWPAIRSYLNGSCGMNLP